MNIPFEIHSTSAPSESLYLSQSPPCLSGGPGRAHLSDDQIDDHLIGDLAAEPAAHLAACPMCTDRVAEAADPMAKFLNATMAWSERRSATLPIPDLSQQRPLWQRHIAWLTACFAFAVSLALTNNSRLVVTGTAEVQPMPYETMQQASFQAPALPEAASTSVSTVPNTQQLSADNQMLQAVDDEIGSSADSPAALGIEPVSAHPTRSHIPFSVQD